MSARTYVCRLGDLDPERGVAALADDRVSFPSISLLSGATDPAEGQEFIDFALGDAGQEILADHGLASAENPHLQPED